MEITQKELIKIYADNREINSRIANILKKHCIVEEKQLSVGDYLLSKRVAVERKTTNDFINSIIDGRLFRQIEELKRNFRLPVLVIEGNNLFNNERKIHPNAIRGALASITLDYGVPIIKTENNLETAEMLLAIAKREQIEMKKNIAVRGRKLKRSPNEMQEYLIAGLPKINRAKARALLKYFGTPEKIFMASKEELMEVEGVGEKLAKKIRMLVTKKYEKSILED